MSSGHRIPFLFILLIVPNILCDGPSPHTPGSKYEGAYLGKLNTYSHQVTGDVYVIDEYTFLIKNFHYDGLSQDAFFWAGATSVRPSNIGFIIPDENGRTNRLRRYINQDVRIRIPDDKKVNSLKWLSIWDIRDNHNFADIYIPDGFEPPSPKRIGEFKSRSGRIKSGPVTVIDSKTIRIESLVYDGQSNSAFFMAGNGPQPTSGGKKITNDLGYLESLGRYSGETITLNLPGEMTTFDIDWISIMDEESEEDYGHFTLPEGLNIPPSLAVVKKRESRLPNCEQLHEKLQVSWEIFGPQITFELSADTQSNDYIAFGISGSQSSSKMVGADIAINYLDGPGRGLTEDYNITAPFPCTNVNGFHKGVCPDTRVGGVDNYQILTFYREEGITRITYRRNLLSSDESDYSISKDPSESTYIVWAIGRMNKQREPRWHHLYPRKDVKISFGRKPEKNCFPFVKRDQSIQVKADGSGDSAGVISSSQLLDKPWRQEKIVNQSLTIFYSRIGVSGGLRGSQNEEGSPGYIWYINGLMTPVLFVRRGQQYVFRVEGGSTPSNPEFYHPLYITNDPSGGYSKLSEQERKKVTVYAGIDFDRRGRPSPSTGSSGRLCLWNYPKGYDPRKVDSTFTTFPQFRTFLNYTCDTGGSSGQAGEVRPGLLHWTPNASTPDLVYYQSYTQRNMGGRIYVIDDWTASSSHVVGSRGESIEPNLLILIVLLLVSFVMVDGKSVPSRKTLIVPAENITKHHIERER